MFFTRRYTVPARNGYRYLGWDECVYGPELQQTSAVLVFLEDTPYPIDGVLAPGKRSARIKTRRRWWLFGPPEIVAADLGWGGMRPARVTTIV